MGKAKSASRLDLAMLLGVLLWGALSGTEAQAVQSIFVADNLGGVVHVLDQSGNYLGVLGQGILVGPVSGLIDQKGNLLVSDQGEDYFKGDIKIFNPQGQYLASMGQGLFRSPIFLTSDSMGNIYVSDYCNGKVEVFDADYQHLRTLDLASLMGPNFVYGDYEGPSSISYDPFTDSLIVTTLSVHREGNLDRGILEVSLAGDLIRHFGFASCDYYKCLVLQNGGLLTTDSQNTWGVSVYDPSRNPYTTWMFSSLANPYCLAQDRQGAIYLGVTSENAIDVFAQVGHNIAQKHIYLPQIELHTDVWLGEYDFPAQGDPRPH